MATFSIKRANAKDLYDFCIEHEISKFFICKDDGAYIGATTGSHKDGTFKNSIHYVEGCNPDINKDWYDVAHSRYGGDDFGEHIPIRWLELFLTDPDMVKKRKFGVKVDNKTVSLVW